MTNKKKFAALSSVFMLAVMACTPKAVDQNTQASYRVEVAAEFDHRPTGVAIADDGRVLVSLPFAGFIDRDQFKMSLAVISEDNTIDPYPNASWNRKPTNVDEGDWNEVFLNIQRHTIDKNGRLWVLDRGRPAGQPTKPGQTRLLEFDTTTDEFVRSIAFNEEFATKNFLNDVRVDTQRNVAFVTDTANWGVILIDLNSGAQRWVIRPGDWMIRAKRAPSVQGVNYKQEWRDRAQHGPDGLAISPDNEWLYLHGHPWLSPHLYRIQIDIAVDEALSPDDIAANIELVAETVYSDGIETDAQGRIYMTDLEGEAVTRFDPAMPQNGVEVLASDPRISWPDAVAIGKNGDIYVTAAQFHKLPGTNDGVDQTIRPLQLLRLTKSALDQ